MKQQLRKPENWQDFEELCWMLWSEIWRCPEAKKNGRTGQDQSGVDVYGVPQGEAAYYGIQCKGKDDYTNAKLTKKEVDTEIEKAKKFKPKLKKLYFTTTANKDVDIEEYIRIKDIECREESLFEVHLYSWEDIVSLIDQYQRTHDWYVKRIKFKTDFGALVAFSDGSNRLVTSPKLFRTLLRHIPQGSFEPISRSNNFIVIDMPTDYAKIYNDYKKRALSPQPYHYEYGHSYFNKSNILFAFQIDNTGDRVLEDFKIEFKVNGSVIAETVDKKKNFRDTVSYEYNISINDTFNGTFKPKQNILIQGDTIKSDLICVRPTIESAQEIKIDWKLLCRDFSDKGKLFININPEVKYQQKDFYCYNTLPEDDTLIYDDNLRLMVRVDNEIE